MKKLSPQEIEKDIQTASNKEFTPAGKVGIKRLKLSFQRYGYYIGNRVWGSWFCGT